MFVIGIATIHSETSVQRSKNAFTRMTYSGGWVKGTFPFHVRPEKDITLPGRCTMRAEPGQDPGDIRLHWEYGALPDS